MAWLAGGSSSISLGTICLLLNFIQQHGRKLLIAHTVDSARLVIRLHLRHFLEGKLSLVSALKASVPRTGVDAGDASNAGFISPL